MATIREFHDAKEKAKKEQGKMYLRPMTDPVTNASGLSVVNLVAGQSYIVRRYHTGDFVGCFIEPMSTVYGLFEIIMHEDPERVGARVEIPHTLAVILPATESLR
jgi:hypothetical protein